MSFVGEGMRQNKVRIRVQVHARCNTLNFLAMLSFADSLVETLNHRRDAKVTVYSYGGNDRVPQQLTRQCEIPAAFAVPELQSRKQSHNLLQEDSGV